MITNINSFRLHYNESWAGISLGCHKLWHMSHTLFYDYWKSVTEILLKSVTFVTFVTPWHALFEIFIGSLMIINKKTWLLFNLYAQSPIMSYYATNIKIQISNLQARSVVVFMVSILVLSPHAQNRSRIWPC